MSEVAVCSDEMLGAFFSPFWRLIKFILSYLILSYTFYLALVLIRASVAMPSIGAVRDSDDVIDVVSINGNEFGTGNGQAFEIDNVNEIKNGSDLMDNGNLTYRLQEINNIPEKRVSVDELIRNLALSGNEKQIKLASELLELNLVQESKSEQLGSDCFDKISASQDNLSTNNYRSGRL